MNKAERRVGSCKINNALQFDDTCRLHTVHVLCMLCAPRSAASACNASGPAVQLRALHAWLG